MRAATRADPVDLQAAIATAARCIGARADAGSAGDARRAADTIPQPERARLFIARLGGRRQRNVRKPENTAGEPFGEARLETLLHRMRAEDGVASAVEAEAATFRGAAEPADDVSLLVLRHARAPGSLTA